MIISLSGYAGSGKDTAGKIIQYIFATIAVEKSLIGKQYITLEQWLYMDTTMLKTGGCEIKKWATALRKCAAILLGMDEQFLYTEEFKEMVLGDEWALYKARNNVTAKSESDWYIITREQYFEYLPDPKWAVSRTAMTGRMFLQKMGTDAVRDGLHPNAWVNALMAEYKTSTFTAFPEDLEIGEKVIAYYPNWIITDTRFPNELAAIKERGGVSIRINRDMYMDLPEGGVARASHNPTFDNYHPSETALDNAPFDYIIDNNGTIEELANKLRNVLSWILPPSK